MIPAQRRVTPRWQATGALLCVFVLTLGAGVWTTRRAANDAVVINLAGRQRLLSQQIVGQAVISAVHGQPIASRPAIRALSQQFEEALSTLKHGGPVDYGDRTVSLPRARNDAFRETLDEVASHWNTQLAATLAMLAADPSKAGFEQTLERLQQASDQTLQAMDRAVQVHERSAATRIGVLTWLQASLAALASLLLVSTITEHRRALRSGENELERLNEMTELQAGALAAAANGIMITDREGKILWVNRAFTELTGYTEQEAIGSSPRVLKSGRQGLEVYDELWETVLAGRVWQGTLVNRRSDGSLYTERQTITPMVGADGEIRCFIAVKEDITRQREAQEALRVSEERYRGLFDESQDAILFCTPAGRIQDINRAGLRLLGVRSREELPTVSTLWDNPRDGIEVLKRLEAEGSVQDLELRLRDSAGRKLTVLATSSAVRDESGRTTQYRGTLRDITESRRLKQRLRQGQKMQALGQLAGGISHDFNNLLTVISGFVEMVLDRVGPENPVHADLEMIKDAGQKAAGLTRQLLAFSRRQVLQPRVLDLNRIVVEFEPLLRRTIPESIEIRTVQDPELGRVKVDPGQIQQVLLNLVVNARDAMPGGGTIVIETQNVELDEAHSREHQPAKPGPHVMLAVTDTGHGMDDETMSRVFEPFFTTRPAGEGTGLGLATVFGIVNQSGGTIWVYSQPGAGTAFKIYLPRLAEPAESGGSRGVPAEAAGGSETILVVEDNVSIRELAVRTLENKGYQVLVADRPETALRYCEARGGDIELLVTDLVMPGGTGVELAREITRRWPAIKVLYMSGYASTEILGERLSDERLEFLAKPFGAAALARKVREILDGLRGSRRSRA